MAKFTDIQKKKIARLLELSRKENSALIIEFLELQEKFEESVEKLMPLYERFDEVEKQLRKDLKLEAGKDYPTEEQVLKYIKKSIAELPKPKDANEKKVIDEVTANLVKMIKQPKEAVIDYDYIKNSVLSSIELPKDGENGLDGSPDTAFDVRNKLELLENEERLRIEAIRDLREELDEIKKDIMAKPSGGGGVTNARISQAFKYILKTEQPSGDIDGANTDYTLTNPIRAIVSMSLNGEFIAQIPNYTISGNTISFSTALPAVYSGKDWEVTYISM